MKNILILILAILTTQHLKAQYFTEVTPSPFKVMFDGNSVFTDVDNDGDLDLFIVGLAYIGFANTEDVVLYRNDGNGNYTEDTGNSFEGVRLADVAVADVNGNGYMDLLISGRNSSGNAITNLYLNDGTGQYTLDNSVSFDGVEYGTVDFADFNGDGAPDVLITGDNGNINGITKIYFNDGSGSFTEQTGTPLIGVDYSAVIILDVNGDNHLDIIISGDKGNPDYSTNLYINNGVGQFTLQNSGLLAINRGALAYADVDGDGDLDVVVSGRTTGSTKESKLFLNDGTGVFTEQTSLALTGVEFASVGFSDINCDGNLDLIVSGLVSNNNRSCEMFINDGNGNFSLYPLNSIEPISQGSISFGDVDGDLDDDLLITGISTGAGMMGPFDKRITRLYLNECIVLPIELISFTGEYKDLTNILTWVTSSERNNDYFILSYSSNGEHWEIIKKIPGAGNSNSIQHYQVNHNKFKSGINYYKLKQIDYDGQAKVYPIISIDNSETNAFLIKRINTIGQEVTASYKGLVIEYYSNGKTIKKWNN